MTNQSGHPTAYIAVGQHDDTGLFHGLVYRNHKKPSGLDRWLLSLSTNEGFETERAAGEYMNAQFPELAPVDVNQLSDKNEFADMPTLPVGAEVTVMTYNPRSNDPVPKDELPQIVVNFGGKRTDIKLSKLQVDILVKRKLIELDSTTDFDPNLSCVYTHFYAVATCVKQAAMCA